LAIANFIEMRDHAASPGFRMKKRIERILHSVVPGYVPLYSMVSFTRIPYAEAVRRAKRQTRIVAAVAIALVAVVAALLAGLVW
jgi:kynurenine 3-monooxygenase